MRLYTYLATEFAAYAEIYHLIQPISGILQTLHTIKYFYWIVDPSHRSGYQPKGSGKDPNKKKNKFELSNKFRWKSTYSGSNYRNATFYVTLFKTISD